MNGSEKAKRKERDTKLQWGKQHGESEMIPFQIPIGFDLGLCEYVWLVNTLRPLEFRNQHDSQYALYTCGIDENKKMQPCIEMISIG